MELTSSEIRGHSFPQGRRGYEPEAVDAFLSDVADVLAALETEVAQARESEEAVKLTFVAAAQAKQDLIDEARRNADAIVEEAREETASARQETQRLRHKAEQDVETITVSARREALELLAASRADAETLTRELRADHDAATARVAAALEAVTSVKQQLQQLADGSIAGLGEVATVLGGHQTALAASEPPTIEPAPETVTSSAPAEAVVEAPEPDMASSFESVEATQPEAELVPAEAVPAADRQGELLAALQSLSL